MITLTLTKDMAHAVMDALANNIALHEAGMKRIKRMEIIDDDGAARPYDTYQEVGRQLFDQGWGDGPTGT